MKAHLSFLLKMFLFVVAVSLCCAFFLFLCYCIPLNVSNYEKSVDELDKEGWYSDVLELRPAYDQNFLSDQPGIQPVHNDRKDYFRAAGLSSKGPLYNAMVMVDEEGNGYARYWHGYAGALRLLLLLFDCKEIKFLSFIFQILLFVMVALRIRDEAGNFFLFLFFLQYILLMPLVVSVSMVFAFSIDIALLGLLIYMCFHEKLEKGQSICFFFCMIGMMTCFWEELVFGILTWGFVCLWVVILHGKNLPAWKNLINVVKTGLSWIWGYAGIWLMKWVYATLITGEDIIQDGLNNVQSRSSSNAGMIDKTSLVMRILDRLSAIRENYAYYEYSVYYVLLALGLVFLTARFCVGRFHKDTRIPALGLIFVAPFAWYIVLANHTLGHRVMTYRIMDFGIIALFAILFCSVSVEKIRKSAFDKKQFLRIGVFLLLGGMLACLKTETFETMNVGYPGELLHFSELNDNTLRMRLTPLFGRIQRIKLNIEPEDYSGTYEIRLSQNDRQVYSKSLDAYWLAEENWTLIELDWKVKPRQEYLFEIIPHTQEGQEGFITFCTPDIGATRDVGNLIEDGEETECQVSFWITYRKRIQGKKFVFYALTWYAVMMGLGVIIYQFWGIRKGKV